MFTRAALIANNYFLTCYALQKDNKIEGLLDAVVC